MRILLSAGDDSGDLHAANLMAALRARVPDAEFLGLGMERMRAAGLEPLDADGPADSAMWLVNLLRAGQFRRRLAVCRDLLRRDPPDLVVPVDFGGFNLFLCREATRRGVPVFYYIPPQVWAHGRYRLKKLRRWTTRCGLIHPFEGELYARYGVEATFVGHPLFDHLAGHPPRADVVAGLHERFGTRLVGVFPGSRRQEVRAMLPILREASGRVREAVPEAEFAMVCPPRMRPELAGVRGGTGRIEALDGVRPVELARAAHVCLTKSGTITLEIASQRTPMVIGYRASPVSYFFATGLMDVPYMGLINNLAGRAVCPERLLWRDDAGWVAREALRLMRDDDAHARCRAEMARTLDGFAEPGASDRAARAALELV